MDKMTEKFEASGAGGNWEYPVDRSDPSVEWAWRIWKAAWIAATKEARDTWVEMERSNDQLKPPRVSAVGLEAPVGREDGE